MNEWWKSAIYLPPAFASSLDQTSLLAIAIDRNASLCGLKQRCTWPSFQLKYHSLHVVQVPHFCFFYPPGDSHSAHFFHDARTRVSHWSCCWLFEFFDFVAWSLSLRRGGKIEWTSICLDIWNQLGHFTPAGAGKAKDRRKGCCKITTTKKKKVSYHANA